MYKLFKGQLIVLWIAGLLLAFISLANASNYSDWEVPGLILGIGLPAFLLFYSIGWKHQRRCPKCQSMKVQRMEYGTPADPESNPDVFDAGCVQEDDSPEWHCASCGHEWRTSD